MTEEKTNEKPKEEGTPKPAETESADTGEGNKYETTPVIERARQENERLEKNTAELKIENDRAEAIAAKRELGGMSEAGQQGEKKLTEEEKTQKGAEEFFAGTQLEKDIKKANEKK